MRQRRFVLSLLLGAILGIAACSEDSTAPSVPATGPTPVFSLTGTLQALLLKCTPLSYTSKSKEIGPDGGELWIGPHYLAVAKGSLKSKVTIRGEIGSGNFNSVRFYPEGLQFGSGTKLYLSYANCSGLGMLLPKKIIYVTEGLDLLELLTTSEDRARKLAISPLKHFSRYALAY
jgi:hypothetical protein